MLNIFLVVHIVISVLLISVILLQKNSSDGLAGLAGGNNTGVVSARSAANFFVKITVFLAVLFMANSLLLANLSNKTHKTSRITEQLEKEKSEPHVPMSK